MNTLENVIFFVYELICVETGKWYIGCSLKKNSHPDQLGKTYFTSSKKVSELYKTNPDKFTVKILFQSDDKNKVYEFETKTLFFRDAKNDLLSWNCHNNDRLANPSKINQLGGLIGGKSNAVNKTGFCGRSKEKMSEDGRKAGLIGGKKGGLIGGKNNTFENRSKAGKIGVFKVSKEAKLRGLKITNSRRFKCGECDMITTSGPLSRHQKLSGHAFRIEG